MHYKELLIMASLFLVCLSLYFSDEIIYFVKKNIKKIKSKNINRYMYHVVVMEETGSFPVMSIKSHYANRPHCRMYILCNNEQRIYLDAKIIASKGTSIKREKIKHNLQIKHT
jgi:hypothetical protein